MSKHPADGPAPESRRGDQPPPRTGQPQRCKLILHAGSGKDAMFIVNTIMELTRLCMAEATHKMWEAHHSGRSQVLVTHRERGELYVEQFALKGLTVSLEGI